MINSKVSVIVPIYNCEKTLDKCIGSILNQSYENIELILVDDGSIDNSNFICREYEKTDNRVSLFYQENSGASSARNLGLLKAQGDFVIFTDSDDYMETNLIEILINCAESQMLDFVMCGFYKDYYDSKGTLLSSVECGLNRKSIHGNKLIANEIIDLIENERISAPWCKLIKKSIIKEYNLKMPEHITLQEDLYFNLNILKHIKRMGMIDRCLYHYINGIKGSLTTRYFSEKYEMTNEVHDLMLSYYNERCNDIEILKRVKYIYIKNTFAACINLFHKDCSLTKNDKMLYIDRIIRSDKFSAMISDANKPGLKYQILKLILKTKNKALVYYASKLFNIMKYKLGLKYLS